MSRDKDALPTKHLERDRYLVWFLCSSVLSPRHQHQHQHQQLAAIDRARCGRAITDARWFFAFAVSFTTVNPHATGYFSLGLSDHVDRKRKAIPV